MSDAVTRDESFSVPMMASVPWDQQVCAHRAEGAVHWITMAHRALGQRRWRLRRGITTEESFLQLLARGSVAGASRRFPRRAMSRGTHAFNIIRRRAGHGGQSSEHKRCAPD